MLRRTIHLLGCLAMTAAIGCGGGPPPVATQNRVFYDFDDVAMSLGGDSDFERHYPILDSPSDGGRLGYRGVTILGGTVRMSRPVNWRIRRASLLGEKRFIEYVSPNQYLFSIFERVDSPAEPWHDVLPRYEANLKESKAEILGSRVPVATANAQGRQYWVRRTRKGIKGSYSNVSHEIVLRGDHRILLVEIVHSAPTIQPISGELLRVMETLELL